MSAPDSENLLRLAELEAERRVERIARQVQRFGFRPESLAGRRMLEIAKLFFASGFVEGALTPLDAETYEARIAALEDAKTDTESSDRAEPRRDEG